MEDKILEFARLLRQAGLKTSISEVLDSVHGLRWLDLDRETFYHTLLATMVKDQADLGAYNKLFDYFFAPDFYGHRQDLPGQTDQAQQHRQCSGDTFTGDGERSTGLGQGNMRPGIPTGDRMVQLIKLGSPDRMTQAVREAVANLGRLEERHLNMEETLKQVKVFLEWHMGVNCLDRMAELVDEETWLSWQDRLSEMETILRRELEKALLHEFKERALGLILTRENLNQLDFYMLSKPQVQDIRKKISKFAHRLATRKSFREKRANRGRIDLQGTIRKSMATGGTPIRPAFKDRKPSKPEIVILCDISGSVRLFSEFMLQLVYSVQSRFLHVKSFVFVDTVDEITAYFRNREVADAIRDVYNHAFFSKTGFSNYGESFVDFTEKYGHLLNKKTTLIILGDARNNYHRDQCEYFTKIVDRVKKVIWLNPEPVEKWDKEDSIMRNYGAFCGQVFECRNLAQLEWVAGKIL